MRKIKRFIGDIGLKFARISPQVYVAAGVGFMFTGTVLTAIKTTKLEEKVLEPTRCDIEDIHIKEDDSTEENPYTKTQKAKDLMKVYGKAVGRMAKVYIVPALVTIAGASFVFYGHNMMAARNAAIAAAYETAVKTHNAYRKRVREELGEEADIRFETGKHPEYKEDIEILPNGKEKSIAKTCMTVDEDIEGGAGEYKVLITPDKFAIVDDKLGFDNTYALAHIDNLMDAMERKLVKGTGHVWLDDILNGLEIYDDKMPKEARILGVAANYDAKEPTSYIAYETEETYVRHSDGSADLDHKVILLTIKNLHNIMSLAYPGHIREVGL